MIAAQGKSNDRLRMTEIGPVATDWRVVDLGQLIRAAEYGSSAKSKKQGSIPVLRMGNLQDGKLVWGDLVFTDDESEIAKYRLYPRDVLFNRTNTLELVGKTAIYRGERPAIFAGYLIRVLVDPARLDARFLNYVLNTEFAKRHSLRVLSVAVGQANINAQKLKTYPIPLPPTLAEQEAIARALSDADAWIESLEALVAKKRAVKQAVMQQLLTGKKRLPGFEGKWETLTLGETADCLDNLRVPLNESQRAHMNGPYPYCGANGVLDHVSEFCVDDDVILMAEDGGHFDEFETRPIAYRMRGKIWVNNHAHILKAKRPYDHGFLFYSLVHKDIREFLASGTRAKLNKGELVKIRITQPTNPEEQAAIATALSDADEELAALESKLAKARQIKQGMMQELLTGKRRLVKPEAAA